eukprot:SAG31_NODE_2137_length_6359_cov_83.985144_2_plen_379_part_01
MQTIIASYTGADGEEPLTSDIEMSGNPLAFEHYNIDRAKKKAIAGISQESLFRRNDGGWIKTNAPMFDEHITSNSNYRTQTNQRSQGEIRLIGGAWTPEIFNAGEGHEVNNTIFDATTDSYIWTGETYTSGEGNLRRLSYSLTRALGLQHLEDNPVTIGEIAPTFSEIDPQVAEGVRVSYSVTIEGDLTHRFQADDLASTFATHFNDQAMQATGADCEPRYGTCLRVDSISIPFPTVSYFDLQVLVVTDWKVDVTASDGSVTKGRQGYSLHATSQGGDFAILEGEENDFDHTFALGYLLNRDCVDSYIYSKSASSSDFDAGYDSSGKAGCTFVDSDFDYTPIPQKADSSSFAYVYSPHPHEQNFYSALDNNSMTFYHSN